MAINLQPRVRISVNLGAVVKAAVANVQAVRSSEQARLEAEFQRAIADGMSYDEQVKFREKQLKDERGAGFIDDEYIAKLEKAITDTKKLARFDKYRSKYALTLGELSSGKINEEDYLKILKNQLVSIDDPDLRLEIQTDIAGAEAKVKAYQDTIVANRVKKAQYDGTSSSLQAAIRSVKTARSQAAINDNEDEVTAYDETLAALNGQLSTVKVQDAMTDFQVKSATRGVDPIEKLDFINSQLTESDSTAQVKIGEKSYASAQQFWTLERDNFLAGSSQIFGDFFSELKAKATNAVNANAARFGYPTQAVLDDTVGVLNGLRARPEVTPFLAKLDITQASVMSEAVDKLAKVIQDVGTNNLTFQEADAQLQAAGAKYGIDVGAYRLQLDEQLRNLARGGVLEQGEAAALAADVQIGLPKIDSPVVAGQGTATPGIAPVAPTSLRVVRAGDTASGIAREAGITLQELINANPSLQQNPNIIRPGQELKLPSAIVPTVPTVQPRPVVSPTPAPTPAPAPSTRTPAPSPTAAPTVLPKPVAAPVVAPLAATAPVVSPTGTTRYAYIDTNQQQQIVEATSEAEAYKKAVNIDPHSGLRKL